jgi:hypothetical protein
MSVAARIFVRTNVNWSAMDAEAFASQADPTRPLPFINGAVTHDLPGAFRDAFHVDFFRYRAAIRQIAQSSLERVQGARRSFGFDDFDAWFYDERDELVFPIDDDDLFHPELARAVDRVAGDTCIVVWDSVQAGFLDHDTTPGCRRYVWPALFSNNWGVRKSFLRKAFDAPTCRRFLADHLFAQECMVRQLDVSLDWMPDGAFRSFAPLAKPGVVLLADCYSLNYFHVGSACFFGALVEQGSPRELYRHFDPSLTLEVGDYALWADGYLREFSSVVPRLRQKARL